MKALFLTEGGRKAGFGHIARCVALSEAFGSKKVCSSFLINGDKTVLPFLGRKKMYLCNWPEETEKLFCSVAEHDIVVIDSYLAGQHLYEKISAITGGRLLMIDDYNRLNYPKGIVVNPSIYGDKLNYKRNDLSLYLLGKDFIILRKEFLRVPKKLINKTVKNILITFGGVEYAGFNRGLFDYLKERFKFNFLVIDSKNKVSAKKMCSLMYKADICICAGGQTTYELARCGLPAIGICFADNQLLNLKGWQRAGSLKFVGSSNDKEIFDKIAEAIKWLGYRTRVKMGVAGQSSVDAKGPKRITQKVLA